MLGRENKDGKRVLGREKRMKTQSDRNKFSYRAYLDGVRGLSVMFVVLFHTGIGIFRECFLGVDVFFVLSGYLITSIILREIASSGWIDIFQFYSRRARRILPAAAITLVVVSLLYRLLVAPISFFEHQKCFIAAATYWANICFVLDSLDYWAEGKGSSPVKHYWSLSVEEQFYLVYPFCLLVILYCLRKFGEGEGTGDVNSQTFSVSVSVSAPQPPSTPYPSRKVLLAFFVFLLLVVISSGVYAVHLALRGTLTQSHMSSFGRCYQLGCGGILALFLCAGEKYKMWWKHLSVRTCSFFCSVFMVAIIALMMYPIVFVNVVVLPSFSGMFMAFLVVCFIFFMEYETLTRRAGNSEAPGSYVRKFSSFRVFVYLGKLSYSIYLWHFPFIIVFGDELELLPIVENGLGASAVRVVVILGSSVLLGVFSYYAVERPFMRISIGTSMRKKLLSGLGIVVPLLSVVLILLISFAGLQMNTMDQISIGDILSGGGISSVYDDVNKTDSVAVFHGGKLLLFGDSHAGRAKKAWDAIASELDFELKMVQGRCMPPALPDWNWESKAPTDKYWEVLRNFPDETIRQFRPDIMVIHNHCVVKVCLIREFCSGRPDLTVEELEEYERKISVSFKRFLKERVEPLGVKQIVYLLPTPENIQVKYNSRYCLQNLKEEYKEGDCDWDLWHRNSRSYLESALRTIAKERDGDLKIIDLDPLICPNSKCPGRYKGVEAFSDYCHPTPEYWMLLAKDFVEVFKRNDVFFGHTVDNSFINNK